MPTHNFNLYQFVVFNSLSETQNLEVRSLPGILLIPYLAGEVGIPELATG